MTALNYLQFSQPLRQTPSGDLAICSSSSSCGADILRRRERENSKRPMSLSTARHPNIPRWDMCGKVRICHTYSLEFSQNFLVEYPWRSPLLPDIFYRFSAPIFHANSVSIFPQPSGCLKHAKIEINRMYCRMLY